MTHSIKSNRLPLFPIAIFFLFIFCFNVNANYFNITNVISAYDTVNYEGCGGSTSDNPENLFDGNYVQSDHYCERLPLILQITFDAQTCFDNNIILLKNDRDLNEYYGWIKYDILDNSTGIKTLVYSNNNASLDITNASATDSLENQTINFPLHCFTQMLINISESPAKQDWGYGNYWYSGIDEIATYNSYSYTTDNLMPDLEFTEIKSTYCVNESNDFINLYLNATDPEDDVIYYAEAMADTYVYSDLVTFDKKTYNTYQQNLGVLTDFTYELWCNIMGNISRADCIDLLYNVEFSKDFADDNFEYVGMNSTDSFNREQYCIYKDFDNETYYRMGLNANLCPNLVLGYTPVVVPQANQNYFFDLKIDDDSQAEFYWGLYYYLPEQMDKVIVNRTAGTTYIWQKGIQLANTTSDLLKFKIYQYYTSKTYDLTILDRSLTAISTQTSLNMTTPVMGWINARLKKGYFSLDNFAVWQANMEMDWQQYDIGDYVSIDAREEGIFNYNIYVTDYPHLLTQKNEFIFPITISGDCEIIAEQNFTKDVNSTLTPILDEAHLYLDSIDKGRTKFNSVFYFILFIVFIFIIITMKDFPISLIITGTCGLLSAWLISGDYVQMITSTSLIGFGITILITKVF